MNCLIVAATPMELAPFLSWFKAGKNLPAAWDIDILVTGIGLTATTYSLTRHLQLKRPGLIIQAGVGGCFDKKIPLGTVMAIRQETIADQSVIELNRLRTLFNLKLVPRDQFPFSKGWLVNNSGLLKKTRLKKVTGISVNEITTSAQKLRFYREEFDPVVESMEGAALHYVCLMEQVPFIQLRAVSNYIAERNKKNWNMKESVMNLNDELIRLISKL